MEQRSSYRMLFLGLVVSLLLHAAVLVPALVGVMTADSTTPGRLMARFEPEDFYPPPEELPDDSVKLGIDESTESTMTWIGYDEYEEHLAALAETEQAAFTDSTAGGTPSEPASSPAPAPTAPEPQPPDNAQDESGETADPLAEFEAWLEASQVGPGPPVAEPTDPAAETLALEDLLESLERMLSEAPDPQPQREATPPQPPQPQEPQQPAKPSETNAPPTPPGEPADPSDQESDATSTRDVPLDDIKLGKPFAAQGLRIKPRRPEFTTLTLLTAAPNNPLAELRFRRDGKPQRVRILRSSGDARIDEGILNSLYRWRASGKKLQELKKGETIPVRIQIVLFGK